MRPVLLSLICVITAAPAVAGLTWEQTTLHLEAAPLEETIEAAFRFANVGDKPVTITQTHASCGCTVPSLDKKTYAPGERGELRLVYTVTEGATGRQEKTVTVLTDDPAGESQLLTLSVEVPGLWEIQPRFVRWENGEQPVAKTITIRALHPDVVRPASVESKDPRCTVELQPSKDETGVYVVTLRPTSTAEPFMTSVLVETTAPAEKKQRHIQLYAVVR